MMRRLLKYCIISAAIITSFALFVFFTKDEPRRVADLPKQATSMPVVQSQPMFFEPDNFQRALSAARGQEARNDIQAIMVPHHLLASRLIAEQYARSIGRDIGTVVVVGPNHFNTGAERITSAKVAWRTHFGDVATDVGLADRFMKDLNVSDNPSVFLNEHSIGSQMPFIEHFFPEASVLAIAYSSYAQHRDVQRVSEWLVANLPENSLIVYSIDFSHYLTREEAEKNDAETLQLIDAHEIEKILTLGNDHMDSPATLATSLLVAEMDHLSHSVIENSNSDDFSVSRTAETTSYFALTFSPATETPNDTSTLLFAGDVMLSRAVGDEMHRRDDWSWPFRLISQVTTSADVFFGNLEGPISDRGQNVGSQYSFRADPRVVRGLLFAGFDMLSVANNHMGDWGRIAFEDTLKILTANGIAYAGGGFDATEARFPRVITVGDTRFAFLAYTPLAQRSIIATETRSGVADFELAAIVADIARAQEIADVIIVSLHMGDEYEPIENNEQTIAYQAFIDAGASLVIGHHPHVAQPLVRYKDGYIAYSLGNLIFDQSFSEMTMRGLLMEVVFDGSVIRTVEEIPIAISKDFQAVFVQK